MRYLNSPVVFVENTGGTYSKEEEKNEYVSASVYDKYLLYYDSCDALVCVNPYAVVNYFDDVSSLLPPGFQNWPQQPIQHLAYMTGISLTPGSPTGNSRLDSLNMTC